MIFCPYDAPKKIRPLKILMRTTLGYEISNAYCVVLKKYIKKPSFFQHTQSQTVKNQRFWNIIEHKTPIVLKKLRCTDVLCSYNTLKWLKNLRCTDDFCSYDVPKVVKNLRCTDDFDFLWHSSLQTRTKALYSLSIMHRKKYCKN